ncbi:MAG TPA: hypothetical protein P5163_00820 [Rubrivivax sp.]|nr:hypothetical protein [Rubrivivax sp.]HRY86397.1 hypothetical protein [Rubrivivax sp.]HRZ59105.1 hypothetical protein [Rubrivivax sp.]
MTALSMRAFLFRWFFAGTAAAHGRVDARPSGAALARRCAGAADFKIRVLCIFVRRAHVLVGGSVGRPQAAARAVPA